MTRIFLAALFFLLGYPDAAEAGRKDYRCSCTKGGKPTECHNLRASNSWSARFKCLKKCKGPFSLARGKCAKKKASKTSRIAELKIEQKTGVTTLQFCKAPFFLSNGKCVSLKTKRYRCGCLGFTGEEIACHEIWAGNYMFGLAKCFGKCTGPLNFGKGSCGHKAKSQKVCLAPRKRVSFAYSYHPQSNATADIRYGSRYEFYNRPGGGKHGNDIAACRVNRVGQVSAFNKDSASSKSVWGPYVGRGCSFAASKGFIVACCIP